MCIVTVDGDSTCYQIYQVQGSRTTLWLRQELTGSWASSTANEVFRFAGGTISD